MLKKFEVTFSDNTWGSTAIRWASREEHIRILSDDRKNIEEVVEVQRDGIADLPDDYRERFIRHFVVEHMSWNGQYKMLLKDGQWQELYLMADGFEAMTRQRANEQDWDWSHVRDASDEAFLRMGNYIWQEVWKRKNSVVYDHCANMVGQAVLGGLDPLELLQ